MTGTMIRPFAAAALLALAAPAFAVQANSSGMVTISTSDIDLSSAKGRKALDRRVDSTINRVCGTALLGTRDEAVALDACRAEVRAAVEPQVQAMLLRASAPGND